MSTGHGITWNWGEAARGAICTAPAVVVVATGNITFGIFCALGVLPVAMVGVPPLRSARPRLVLVGSEFAVAYLLGSVIGRLPVLAVVVLTTVAYLAVLKASSVKLARLGPVLLVPAFALGMNEPPSTGLALAAVFVIGSIWATLVTWAWPTKVIPLPDLPRVATAHVDHDPRVVGTYAVLFALAAGIGLTIGFAGDFDHVAWSAATALFIMRPAPDELARRAVARTVGTFAGISAAALLVDADLPSVVVALIVLAVLAGVIATRSSRWYVAPFGTGLLVLLLSGALGTDEFDAAFSDRLIETAIGATLALTLGVGVPAVLRRRASGAGAAPAA